MNNPNRPKIIEAYVIPEGNVSPDIFALPCVLSVHKVDGQAIYNCKCGCFGVIRYGTPGQVICRFEDGRWEVLSQRRYHEIIQQANEEISRQHEQESTRLEGTVLSREMGGSEGQNERHEEGDLPERKDTNQMGPYAKDEVAHIFQQQSDSQGDKVPTE